jgi:hypothetical protein
MSEVFDAILSCYSDDEALSDSDLLVLAIHSIVLSAGFSYAGDDPEAVISGSESLIECVLLSLLLSYAIFVCVSGRAMSLFFRGENGSLAAKVLPEHWNANQAAYVFVYKRLKQLLVIKAVRIDDLLSVNIAGNFNDTVLKYV